MFLIAHTLFIIYICLKYIAKTFVQRNAQPDHWFGGKMKRNEMKNETKPIYLNMFNQLI